MTTTTFNPDQKRGQPTNRGQWVLYENSDPEAALEVPSTADQDAAVRYATGYLVRHFPGAVIASFTSDMTGHGWQLDRVVDREEHVLFNAEDDSYVPVEQTRDLLEGVPRAHSRFTRPRAIGDGTLYSELELA